MGNCLASASDVTSTTISTNTKPSSTTGTSIGTSNGVGISGTTSSSRSDDDGYLSKGEMLPAADLKVYAYSDLKSCTKNFKSDMVLGIGGFGTVYKGWVEEKTMLPSKNGTGSMVAIKKLNHESVQGFQEWQSEVNFLGRLSHPNLVKLIGYCREDKDLLLVYEFMQKGSLENHLFRRGSAVQPLSWALRLKIAIGAARGLAFLHSSDDNVIYRDIKASNILLDGNYNAKISDFGMAKLGPSGGMSHVTTRIMGTYGYAAPEYIATGHLYVKSDVYGFGVVLLEMMTGLRALDSRRSGPQHNLVEWAKPLLPNRKKIRTIMDARIEGQYSSRAAMMLAQLVLHCLESEPRRRPAMKEVVEVLEQVNSMKVKPK
ncbi:probable serine/threonine-protein kinase PIX13 [Tanacetum coccineum]